MVFLINQRKSIDEEHPRSFSLIALIQEGDDQNHQKVMIKSSEDDDQNHHHDRHHNHSSQDPDMEFVATVTTGGRGIFFLVS